MALKYSTSQTGKALLIYRGYLHWVEKRGNNKSTWKCLEYLNKDSDARLRTKGKEGIHYIEHSHLLRPRHVTKTKKNNARNKAEGSKHKRQARLHHFNSVPPSTIGNVPGIDLMRRTVHCHRKSDQDYHPIPSHLMDVSLPEQHQQNLKGRHVCNVTLMM